MQRFAEQHHRWYTQPDLEYLAIGEFLFLRRAGNFGGLRPLCRRLLLLRHSNGSPLRLETSCVLWRRNPPLAHESLDAALLCLTLGSAGGAVVLSSMLSRYISMSGLVS